MAKSKRKANAERQKKNQPNDQSVKLDFLLLYWKKKIKANYSTAMHRSLKLLLNALQTQV